MPSSPVNAETLADAFSEFMATSTRLESSYRALQRQVQVLDSELADRNAELSATLAENMRMQQERDAARNAIALAQISTMLAHEMRNPLASMELFAELIESDGERRSEWIANLRAGIRTLSGTVNNVLSFHESDDHAQALVLASLPLAPIVTGALDFMRPVATQSGVALHWFNGDSDLRIAGDENSLRQVLLNLISNALRHTPSGGAISFSMMLRPAPDGRSSHIQLLCADTGTGIPENNLTRIFEPGFSGTGDSAGLGLAVCERILRYHGAVIKASNRPDGGACFRLDFPAVALAQEAA